MMELHFRAQKIVDPFYATLLDANNNNLELIFMVNHLTRSNTASRRTQARGLREWAEDQEVAVVAVGDYNFDFDIRNLTGNQSMAIFMRNEPDSRSGTFVWITGLFLVSASRPMEIRMQTEKSVLLEGWLILRGVIMVRIKMKTSIGTQSSTLSLWLKKQGTGIIPVLLLFVKGISLTTQKPVTIGQ